MPKRLLKKFSIIGVEPKVSAASSLVQAPLAALPGVESVSYSHMGPALGYEFMQSTSVRGSSSAPVESVFETVGPGFFRLAGMRVLAADTPGTTRGNMRRLEFKHVTRPIYPLDDFPNNGPPGA